MPLLLTLALLLPFVLTVADVTDRRFEEAAPMVFLGLSLLLYIFGFFSLLWMAVWVVWLLWGVCVLYIVFVLVRVVQKKLGHPKWLTVGAVLFLLAVVALWWQSRGRQYVNWDEYAHWGRAVKAAYNEDAFITATNYSDGFKEYPPGLAPLQALIMKACFLPFRADVAVFTQGLFSASLLLYPLRRCGWKHKVSAVGLAALMLLMPTVVYPRYYTETTVDGLLGVLCAFVLLVHFLGEGGRFERVLLCMGCAMLPLIKSSGVLWAAFAVAVILWDEARVRRRAKKKAGSAAAFIGRWGWRLAPALSALLAAGSWWLFRWMNGIQGRWRVDLGAVWPFATGSGPAWRYETAGSYFSNIFTDLNYGWPVGFLPFMGFFAVFIGVFLLTRAVLDKAHRASYAFGFWLLFGAGILYVLLLLLNYLFIFDAYEAVRLASLSRYLNTYVCAMSLYLTGWLARVLPCYRVVQQLPALLVALGLWVFLGRPAQVLGDFALAPVRAGESANLHRRFEDAAGTIRAADLAGRGRVYIIAIDDFGEAGLRIGYELLPAPLADHTHNISPAYDTAGEVLLDNPTPAEWGAALAEGYDYVYLLEIKDSFAPDYGSLFENPADIADGNIFRVGQGPGGVVLRLVERGKAQVSAD